jgi:hypothetical protein
MSLSEFNSKLARRLNASIHASYCGSCVKNAFQNDGSTCRRTNS